MLNQSDNIRFQDSGFGGSFSHMDRFVTSSQQLTIVKPLEISEEKNGKYKLKILTIAFKDQENNEVTCWAESKEKSALEKLLMIINSSFIGKTWDELINHDFSNAF